MELNGVLAAAFDGIRLLNTTTVAGPSSSDASGLDEQGAWSGAFDEATNTIRVVYV